MHPLTDELKARETCKTTDWLKPRKGDVIKGNKEMMKIRAQHIIKESLTQEADAIHPIKCGKTPDLANITKEELQALNEFSVETITKLVNGIRIMGAVPKDLMRPVFAVAARSGTVWGP